MTVPGPMRNGLLLLSFAVALALSAAAPASAAKKPVIAIGDQKTNMFADPRFDWLGIRHARLVVPWFIETGAPESDRAQVREWLEAARRKGVEPMVGFGHGWIGWTRLYLPTAKEFSKAFRAFRRAYPWVRTYITWNEANHCSQPTCTKPRRAARFFDTIKTQCPRCRVVAAAVLAAPNMGTWIRRFKRAARHKPTLWGLHNYGDINRLRWSGTREFLKLTRGPVWLTETGGVVWRNKYGGQDPFPTGAKRAGRVTRYLLRMAGKHRRIKRIYLYHWNVDRPKPQWDSGIIDWAGRKRGSFDVVARYLGRDPRRAPALPVAAPGPPPPPGPTGEPPPPGEQPPPEEEPRAEEPSADSCGLLQLCPPVVALGA